MSRSPIIVGEGRVGLSLAADLASEEDLSVTVAGRSGSAPAFLGSFPQVPYVPASAPDASFAGMLAGHLGAGAAEAVIIFCVPDDMLSTVAARWVEAAGIQPLAVLHTSGVHSAQVLSGYRERGVPGAAWHPMVAVAEPGRGAFRGVWFGIDGDEAAGRIGRDLAERLGGHAHEVRPDARPHYHAAGVFASNYLVACLRVAVEELRRSSDDVELATLLPLARSALRNLGELGLERGATGPVARGDVETVASHLSVLDRRRAAVYRGLGLELLELTGGHLDPELRERLEALLSSESSEVGEGPKEANGAGYG